MSNPTQVQQTLACFDMCPFVQLEPHTLSMVLLYSPQNVQLLAIASLT